MNAAPIIVRALRAESRRAANYWLRVLAAGVLILVFASIVFGAQLRGSQLGIVLFSGLNQTFFYALWVLVPLMTADCISRERREGTLGLLFLTPLTVPDVIAGKATIHVLRALTLFLAALPALGLPLVLGGVDWHWVVMSAVGLADAALLAIAAGIYASARGGSTIQVMVLAEAVALGLAVFSNIWNRFLVVEMFSGTTSIARWTLAFIVSNVLFSAVAFMFLLRNSAQRLENTWRDEPATPEQPRWVQAWVERFKASPLFQALFQWNKSRTLDRNPMAWLQEYSWTARLTKWGWFILVLIAGFLLMGAADLRQASTYHALLTSAVTLGVAFSGVGSFRREQQSGLLELLLVTPLTVRQVLGGRLWGILAHYLPALALLWFSWIGTRMLSWRLHNNDMMTALFPNPVAFGAMMVVGLYFSLSRLNFFLAWLLTWALGFVLPIAGTLALVRFYRVDTSVMLALPSMVLVVCAVVLWLAVHKKVRQRAFVLGKTDAHL